MLPAKMILRSMRVLAYNILARIFQARVPSASSLKSSFVEV